MKQKRGDAHTAKRNAPAETRMQAFLKARAGVEQAESLRLAGKLEPAASVCSAVLKKFPDYVAGLQTMGLILSDQDKFDRALGYLHRASMLNPKDYRILTALSGAYLKLGFRVMAAQTLERARELAPKDASILLTLGEIYREAKEHELSLVAFETAFKADPSLSAAEQGLALNLVHTGQFERATEIYEKLVRDGSRSIGVLYWLSQMPTSLVTLNLVDLLEEAEPAQNQPADATFETHLAFTWAAALDKAGRYDEAWSHLRKARQRDEAKHKEAYRRLRMRHSPLLDLVKRARVKPSYEAKAANDLPMSLFIIGPSRSGKTSLERLVGSLDGVKRGYENPIVENAVERAFQEAAFPASRQLLELPPPLGKLFAEHYDEELKERAQSARVLTNTMPGRIEDAMRIADEIPRSRFAFVKRHIDDIAIRVYMRNYRTGNHYASDLNDIRDYLQWCHKMIDAMADKLGDRALVITYEDMVQDPKAACSAVAELCGLKLGDTQLPDIGDDRGCSEPYKTHMTEVLAGGE